ncbi:MAG: DUF4976 domain-containing protein, partial [Planctomycetota bacterium]|nr:DUF4976 domain-containing protein [Planctomycetota bacterium]
KEIRVLRDKRYKLIRFGLREPFAFELYDLSLDPFETNNLVSPGMSDLVQVAFRRLQTELKRLLAG